MYACVYVCMCIYIYIYISQDISDTAARRIRRDGNLETYMMRNDIYVT